MGLNNVTLSRFNDGNDNNCDGGIGKGNYFYDFPSETSDNLAKWRKHAPQYIHQLLHENVYDLPENERVIGFHYGDVSDDEAPILAVIKNLDTGEERDVEESTLTTTEKMFYGFYYNDNDVVANIKNVLNNDWLVDNKDNLDGEYFVFTKDELLAIRDKYCITDSFNWTNFTELINKFVEGEMFVDISW